MQIFFEDYDKKFKTSILKGIENNINILKNLYDEIYLDSEGVVYSLDSKIENGRVICKTNLHEFINVPIDNILKINSKSLVECFKAGKTKILGFFIDDLDNLIFRTEAVDYNVGNLEEGKKLNISGLENIINNANYKSNLNELLERFSNKEFINIKKDKYDLILTHKLFPMINKCVNFEFKAKDNEDGTFFGVFNNEIIEKNKKDEITFKMDIIYMYRFMDLN